MSGSQRSYRRINAASDAAKILSSYTQKRTEHFLVLTLSSSHDLIHVRVVSMGIMTGAPVHPREVFWWAIHDNAQSVILAHNHPSGNPWPSPQDQRITSSISEAGKVMGIEVLDHIIVAKDGYYSFMENDPQCLVREALQATRLAHCSTGELSLCEWSPPRLGRREDKASPGWSAKPLHQPRWPICPFPL
jgi:proteasome lid subunit RPN8/RPN11